ncbi:hypothetical protein RUND412_005963, partial [Rhizina undulata]
MFSLRLHSQPRVLQNSSLLLRRLYASKPKSPRLIQPSSPPASGNPPPRKKAQPNQKTSTSAAAKLPAKTAVQAQRKKKGPPDRKLLEVPEELGSFMELHVLSIFLRLLELQMRPRLWTFRDVVDQIGNNSETTVENQPQPWKKMEFIMYSYNNVESATLHLLAYQPDRKRGFAPVRHITVDPFKIHKYSTRYFLKCLQIAKALDERPGSVQ